MEKRKIKSLGFLVVILLLAATPIALSKANAAKDSPPLTIQEKSMESQMQAKDHVHDLRFAISTIAEDNIPAIVHINVTQNTEVVNPFGRGFPFQANPFFHRYFSVPQEPKKFRQMKGLGTGMIIKSDGYILTNYHVVGNATEINVTLSNDTQYNAKIVGSDPSSDLAVIKITAKEELPTVTFGDSDKLKVGEWVIAIGHPRGLDQTVTQGIISAKHRHGITNPNNYQDFLQTDAAINPGNSGGPLLNLDGQVIGVNSAIATQSGGSEGIGFAIPSNMAVYIANSLITKGKVERAWLGITIQDITFDKMKALHLDKTKGAVVVELSKDGPAEKAGIKADDVIISLDGKAIGSSDELRNLAANKAVGSTVKVKLIREGKNMTVAVKMGNMNDAKKAYGLSLWDILGAELQPVADKETKRYGLSDGQGFVITKLDDEGPLYKAGVEVGDVLLRINDVTLKSMADLSKTASSIQEDQPIYILLIDHRSGQVGPIKIDRN